MRERKERGVIITPIEKETGKFRLRLECAYNVFSRDWDHLRVDYFGSAQDRSSTPDVVGNASISRVLATLASDPRLLVMRAGRFWVVVEILVPPKSEPEYRTLFNNLVGRHFPKEVMDDLEKSSAGLVSN